MIKRFKLTDLIPYNRPSEYTLGQITEMYALFGTIRSLNQGGLPLVKIIGDKNYLIDGNNRAVWRYLNGLKTVTASYVRARTEDNERVLEIEKRFQTEGIFSIIDLAKTVQNSEKYIVREVKGGNE